MAPAHPTPTADAQAQAQAEAQVRSWGYTTVYTWTDAPNTHYPPHHHPRKTTHLILAGALTMRYPLEETTKCGVSEKEEKDEEKEEEEKKELTVGDRWDVEAGRVHEVWVGRRGCRYVIGELE